ncbi:MAG: glycosyltransferase family 1 protein [Actinomycetales bacterium]|nr:glycosyltransferase family 1 protein [Actinomycetales bacterium]MCP4892900.1 glycosyltransferase family 1 protein [Actinomycetales bacterium]
MNQNHGVHDPGMPCDHPALEGVDVVVMLAWSDLKTEPRSNRFHYAKRFAKLRPVLFVQADGGHGVEQGPLPQIEIVHAPIPSETDCEDYTRRIAAAIRERGFRRPLFWAWDLRTADALRSIPSPFRVLHMTELYLEPACEFAPPKAMIHRMLQSVDMVVTVGDASARSIRNHGHHLGPIEVAWNGCDFKWWSDHQAGLTRPDRRRVVYQGGVNYRLDFDTLELIAREAEADLAIAGRFTPDRMTPEEIEVWSRIKRLPNVDYLGELSDEALRTLLGDSDIGIVPFKPGPMISKSIPLKLSEYLACGLDVVSVPIDLPSGHEGICRIAHDRDEFLAQVRAAIASNSTEAGVEARRQAASRVDYDATHAGLLDRIAAQRATSHDRHRHKRRLLLLVDAASMHVGAVRDHVDGLAESSHHVIEVASCTGSAVPKIDLDAYDGIVVHFSVRLSIEDHMSRAWQKAVREFPGLKLAFVQDEYDSPDLACAYIDDLGIHGVFTCVPLEDVRKIYRSDRVRSVEFQHNLTGYVSDSFKRLPEFEPVETRELRFCYRGRTLPYWYGDLGDEKRRIGVDVRAACRTRGVPCDIEVDDERRIYGMQWLQFLASARAMLGTESGCNVFDWDGSLQREITSKLDSSPAYSYAEAKRDLLPDESWISMNQISPKIFEAIAVRTALVLFEGEYSGVLTPDRHFKPLRKDLGNLDEVLAFLEDKDALRTMTTLAFDEVLLDEKWSYRSLAAMLDDLVDELSGSVPPRVPSAQRVPILLPTAEPARHTSESSMSSQDRNPMTDLLGRIPGRRLVPHGVRRRVLEWMRR